MANASPPGTVPDLVGICGVKYSGKTTLARAFAARGYRELTFAEPMVGVVKHMFGLSDAECTDPELKEKPGKMGVSYRRAMQVFGTDIVRDRLGEFWPELKGMQNAFWIEHMRSRVQTMRNKEVRVVVSDVRFLNEAQFIVDSGGVLLVVERDQDASGDTHASETGVEEIVKTFADTGRPQHPAVRFVHNDSTVDKFVADGLAQAAI